MTYPPSDEVADTISAQEQNQGELLELENVIGVATGFRQRQGEVTDELAVQVFVTRKLPPSDIAPDQQVPESVPGADGGTVPTDVIEMTVPEAYQDTTRYRPVAGGCSIGPESSNSAGTLGGWAMDTTDWTAVLISNNHVISNLDAQPAARRVVQPGRLDGGGVTNDTIGTLKRDVRLQTIANPPPAGTNPPVTPVDAAIATITPARTRGVLQIGDAISSVQAPGVGMNVQKRGRTTRLTTNGRITSINGTFDITYNNASRLGRIENSFIVTSTDGNPFSRTGDSGSLVFNQQSLSVCGLLYGGGSTVATPTTPATPLTFAADINAVMRELNLTVAHTRTSSSQRGIAGVSRIPTSMEMWWVAPNGAVKGAYWYQGFSWKTYEIAPAGSATPETGVASVSRIPNSMEIWWVAPNGAVKGAYWYQGFSWKTYEIAPAGSATPETGVASVSRIPNSMEIWWVAPNGAVKGAYWYEGFPWKTYEIAPAGAASTSGRIAAVSRIPTSMEIWWVAPNGAVKGAYWYEGFPWKTYELAGAGAGASSSAIPKRV